MSNKTTPTQFSQPVLTHFKAWDQNHNGFLSKAEIDRASNDTSLAGDTRAAASTLQDTVELLQGLSDDEDGRDNGGVTRKDLATYARLHAKGDPRAARVDDTFGDARSRMATTAHGLLGRLTGSKDDAERTKSTTSGQGGGEAKRSAPVDTKSSAKAGARGSGKADAKKAVDTGVAGKPVLATKYYANMAGLKKELKIEYDEGKVRVSKPGVNGVNELSEDTVGQDELKKESEKGFWSKVGFGLKNPGLAWNKSELDAVNKLSYVKKNPAGTALGKISGKMFENIQNKPKQQILRKQAGDQKAVTTHDGVRNMFLHVFGQATITTLYGRELADKVGDIHERDQPSLITGKIGKKEEWQAIDNYSDMVNNLYGQDLGEKLKRELKIDDDTVWDDKLTARYLNAVQDDVSNDFNYKFKPFDEKSEDVKKFTALLNHVTGKDNP